MKVLASLYTTENIIFYFCLFKWWAGNYTINESTPEAGLYLVDSSGKFLLERF